VSLSQQLSAFNNSLPQRSVYQIKNITDSTYRVTGADNGLILNVPSNGIGVTFILPPAASVGTGFQVTFWNNNYATCTISTSASDTVDTTFNFGHNIYASEGIQLICDGKSNWQFGIKRVTGLSINGSTGNGTRAYPVASGLFAVAIGYTNSTTGVTASANYTTAIGLNSGGSGSQAVTGAGAMALGGSYASGIDSFAAAIGNNTSTYGATGSTGPVAIGNNNKASGSYATSVGGYQNLGSANWSMALGGRNCTAAFDYSIAYGYVGTPNAIGKVAFGHASGVGAGIGWGTLNLYRATTDATPTILTSDNTAAGSTNQLVLPINSAYTFSIMVVARQSAAGGTASAAWKIEGLIRQEGTAASTTLVNYITTVISNVPGWTIAVSADTTNGGLAITATGAAATNIRWVATAQTSEVTYA